MPRGASRNARVREEFLASRLAQGPLPLPLALRYATDVAAALRELHQAGRTHGEVSANSVVLRLSGARLLPPNHLARGANSGADVAAFGAVLYMMLTGNKPPRSGLLAAPVERAPHAGPPGLRAAATRLAAKCLAAAPDQAPTIQMVVTEVRLLNVLAQQAGAESPAPPTPGPAPARQAPRKSGPWSEWTAAAAQPVEKPARPAPAESFVDGAPTKEFVSAMMSTEPVAGLAPYEGGGDSPDEERADDLDDKSKIEARAPSPVEKCPKCGSREVHESRPRTRFESFVTKFRIPICRCHRCYHRYFVVLRSAFSKTPPE
jgi:DNA-directed RNA polymerase subunit M/transcription elongation factor TFIIS